MVDLEKLKRIEASYIRKVKNLFSRFWKWLTEMKSSNVCVNGVYGRGVFYISEDILHIDWLEGDLK